MTGHEEVCKKEYTQSTDKNLVFLRNRIREAYMHSWVVDNMPVIWCYKASLDGQIKTYCSTRFPLGCYVNDNGRAHEVCAAVVSGTCEGEGCVGDGAWMTVCE